MADTRRFKILMDGLKGGGEFAKTFKSAYGPPAQVAAAWARNPPKSRK